MGSVNKVILVGNLGRKRRNGTGSCFGESRPKASRSTL
jgi:hypothetical protein